MESLTEFTKSLIESRKSTTPAAELCELMKADIEILNNYSIKIASPFWMNAMEEPENYAKQMQCLQMPEATRLPWIKRQVDKMN